VQRAAQDSLRDQVCDPHSTAERKGVDVGDVGERRLEEKECSPVTGIGSRYEGTLYRNITVGILYRNVTVGIFHRNITIGTLVDRKGNSTGSEVT